MNSFVIDKKDEILMRLVHYLITKENYTPMVVRGVKNEVWLENTQGPYKIVRINSNYIHNKEQYNFDIFKVKNIAAQIKRKTLSFKVNVLNICLNINSDVKITEAKNIDSIKIDNSKDIVKNTTILNAFPDIQKDIITEKDKLDLVLSVTGDINKKSERDNRIYEATFSHKKIVVTYIIMILCILTFIASIIYPDLIYMGANNRELVRNGGLYRLLTSGFLHAGFMHLLCNMYSLFVVGSQMETFIGKTKFTIVYFISLLSASLMSIATSNTLSVGASGAIFGILGALLYFGYNYRLYLGSAMKSQIIPIIILNLLLGFTLQGIDNAAHIGGLIGGFLTMMALGINGKPNKRDQINGTIVLILYLIFLMFIGIFMK